MSQYASFGEGKLPPRIPDVKKHEGFDLRGDPDTNQIVSVDGSMLSVTGLSGLSVGRCAIDFDPVIIKLTTGTTSSPIRIHYSDVIALQIGGRGDIVLRPVCCPRGRHEFLCTGRGPGAGNVVLRSAHGRLFAGGGPGNSGLFAGGGCPRHRLLRTHRGGCSNVSPWPVRRAPARTKRLLYRLLTRSTPHRCLAVDP